MIRFEDVRRMNRRHHFLAETLPRVVFAVVIGLAVLYAMGVRGAEPFDKTAAVKRFRELATQEAAAKGGSRDKEITELKASVKKIQAGRIVKNLRAKSVRGDKGEWTFRTTGDRSEALQDAKNSLASKERELADMRAGKLPAGELRVPLTLGAIGYVGINIGHVVQVTGDTEMLVRITNWRAGMSNDKATVLIKGVSTVGVTDGEAVKLPQIFIVGGTERYETALGSKTVFVLEPIDAVSPPGK